MIMKPEQVRVSDGAVLLDGMTVSLFFKDWRVPDASPPISLRPFLP